MTMYNPCAECLNRYGHDYGPECDDRCLYAKALKAEPCDEQSVYMRAYREGYDKGYSDGDFFARHEDETRKPCEDAVSREAVLALAKEECETAIIPYKRFVKGANALPPVTPKQRWIPVRERLPEEWESVLVCFKTQGGMAQAVSERFDGDRWSALCGMKPIAWMPLPEPYYTDMRGEQK